MDGTRGGGRTIARSTLYLTLALIAAVWSAGCGEQPGSPASQAWPTAVSPGSGSTTVVFGSYPATAIQRNDPSGILAGLVFAQPLSLDEACAAVGAELDGDLIALYRSDYACVQPVEGATDARAEPSRFVMADASEWRRSLRLGERVPMGGWVTEAYWERWTDEWRHAQEPGARFEAVAVYLREKSLAAARGDPRFRAVVDLVPRSSAQDQSSEPAYEQLLRSEAFPPGLLTEAGLPDCDSAPSLAAENEALREELRALPSSSWADLQQAAGEGALRKVVGVIPQESVSAHGFVVYVDGDPKQMLYGYYDYGAGPGEDLRLAGLWSRTTGPGQGGEPRSGSATVWGYPSLRSHPSSRPDIVDGFHFVWWEKR